MGLSSSPYIFSKLSDFVVRCSVREGCACIINYLDDFAVVDRSYDLTKADQLCLIAVLRRLGFSISYKKVTPPSQLARFLGIDIDTQHLKLRLPEDKIQKLITVLEEFSKKRKSTRRDLERLGGLLSHCSKVVKGGRSFCVRIYDAVKVTREPYFKFRLSADFKSDVKWWLDFVRRFNGSAVVLGGHAAYISIYTDASLWGFGPSTHRIG